MVKKKFNLKKEYEKSWSYVGESKKFIYFIIAIFLFFGIVGFFVPAPDFISQKIMEYLKLLLEQTEGFSHFDWIGFIFTNNIQSSFFAMIFGAFLGIYPFLGAIVNGYLLGFVCSAGVSEGGFLILWKLLPHGVFELPAIFISLGLGLRLGSFILYKKKKEKFKEFFVNFLRVFFYIIIPLLIVAAVIEGSLIFLAS